MPNVYREKTCPQCEKTHRKRGPYCSLSCSSTGREGSEKQRENMRKVSEEFRNSPEGIAHQKIFHTGQTVEDFAVSIPELSPDISDFQDYERGEDW
jgi:hypothetical protein